MTKLDFLMVIRLLSALESWTYSTKQPLPNHLSESLKVIMDKLTLEVLRCTEEKH